ncbi:MAG TPA: ANTAR domain-containing protein, partial [Rhizobacter sp.]|nr:ANTAR domain-containing protein [Rhizobacter sp.]
FAQLGKRQVEAANTAQAQVGDAMAQTVAMAVGVLMHRYSLSRAAALERLQKLATSESRPLHVQAERLLEAVELLSKPGEA